MQAAKRKPSRYWILVTVIMTVFLAAYGLAEALRLPFLTDIAMLTTASALTALLTTSLLTADVLLPIPSSLVMVANGALFGFLAGSALSLAGNILGFLFAYWLGRRASPLIQKFLSPHDIQRGNHLLQQWGTLAIIATRPLPILAETTTIMAGVARLPFAKSLAAVTVGSLPACVLYAWAGSHAKSFNTTALIFLVLVLLAVIAWRIDKELGAKKQHASQTLKTTPPLPRG